MIKLIYRGVNYHSQQPTQNSYLLKPSNQSANNIQNLDRLIAAQPFHYFTYRGVSYTKTVFLNCDR